jgi:hypothetical protein
MLIALRKSRLTRRVSGISAGSDPGMEGRCSLPVGGVTPNGTNRMLARVIGSASAYPTARTSGRTCNRSVTCRVRGRRSWTERSRGSAIWNVMTPSGSKPRLAFVSLRFAGRHLLIETYAHGEVLMPGNCPRIRRSRQASSPMPMAGGIQITVTATCAIIAVVHTPPKRSDDPAPRLRSCA